MCWIHDLVFLHIGRHDGQLFMRKILFQNSM